MNGFKVGEIVRKSISDKAMAMAPAEQEKSITVKLISFLGINTQAHNEKDPWGLYQQTSYHLNGGMDHKAYSLQQQSLQAVEPVAPPPSIHRARVNEPPERPQQRHRPQQHKRNKGGQFQHHHHGQQQQQQPQQMQMTMQPKMGSPGGAPPHKQKQKNPSLRLSLGGHKKKSHQQKAKSPPLQQQQQQQQQQQVQFAQQPPPQQQQQTDGAQLPPSNSVELGKPKLKRRISLTLKKPPQL